MREQLLGREGQTGVNLPQMAEGAASAALSMRSIEVEDRDG